LERGIGQLVDADMEKTAAKLSAEQVRKQLAIQALSISNSRPQMILQLFAA
jgi:flagellin